MALVHKAKTANRKNKITTFGYVKQNVISCNLPAIPELIIYSILAYYHIPEYFERFPKEYFKVSSNKDIITNITDCRPYYYKKTCRHHCIFLHQNIKSLSSKIYKWTFKVNFTSYIDFGLVTTPIQDQDTHIEICKPKRDPLTNEPYAYYHLSSLGCQVEFPGFCEEEELPYHALLSGDTITIILDLNNKIISCIIDNGKLLNEYKLFTNIWKGENINYNMTLQLYDNGDNVKLLQFEELQGN